MPDLTTVVEFIHQHGYIVLFFSYLVCLLGLPVPNEVFVMTGGLLPSTGYFHPIITFLIIYFAIIHNSTLLYVIGRIWGTRIVGRLKRNTRFNQKIEKASALIQRYGSYAAALCYTLPIVRYCIPFLMGTYRFSYYNYARFSYPSGFVWTLVYYLIGSYFRSKIDIIGKNISIIGITILLLLITVGIAISIRKYFLQKMKLGKNI